MHMPACCRNPVTLALLALAVACLQAQQAAPPSGSAPGANQPASTQSPGSSAPGKADAPAKTEAPAAKDDNAFPEEQSKAAEKQAHEDERADRKAADAGSAVSGTSAESGSSSRDTFAGMDILGDHDSRISNGAGGTIVDPKLSLQDLKVGQQYLAMGNYQGAYERFKEACTVNPANVDAVFYLAEAARKTAHLDESAENYRVYLEVQPDGSKAKAARKALTQLAGR